MSADGNFLEETDDAFFRKQDNWQMVHTKEMFGLSKTDLPNEVCQENIVTYQMVFRLLPPKCR